MRQNYWKKVAGLELYKLNWFFKFYLYKFCNITLPKLKSQHQYWEGRGQVYMDEIMTSGYLEREVFFQNMLIDQLKELDFDSFFEAGCGFGWNVRRVQEEFPACRVGGVDFSSTQLENGRKYTQDYDIDFRQGDICQMPLPDGAYDVGFSLGVFMNIHPAKIEDAAREMCRVCNKYIIHIEYDENQTTSELREKRVFKTNIVSHDYPKIYAALGQKVLAVKTYHDFGKQYDDHIKTVTSDLDRWEGFEGPEKYIFVLVEKT